MPIPTSIESKLPSFSRDLRANFYEGLNGKTPITYDRITTEIPTTKRLVDFPMLKDIPGFRKWVGPRLIHRLEASNYFVRVQTFEDTLGVSCDDIDDDDTGMYSVTARMLGEQARVFPDQQVWDTINAGESLKCYDDQPFFSATHEVNGASVSNLTSGSGKPWFVLDTSKALKPFIWVDRLKPRFDYLDKGTDQKVFEENTVVYGAKARGVGAFGLWQMAHKSRAAFSAENVLDVITAMKQRKNDNGESLGVRPNLVVVHPDLFPEARRVFDMLLESGGASNEGYQLIDWIEGDRIADV